MCTVQERAVDFAIRRVMESHAESRATIPPRPAGLLVVVLERTRKLVVNHESDVRAIDSHAERVGGHDDRGGIRHEVRLNPRALAPMKSGVVSFRSDTLPSQCISDPLDSSPRGGIDESRSRKVPD